MTSLTLIHLPGLHGTAELSQAFLDAMPTDVRRRVIPFPLDRLLSYDALLVLIEQAVIDETDMVIVGESYSGPLALMLATAHPERTRAVVLSATFVRPPLPSWLRWFAYPAVFRLPIPSFMIRFFVAGAGASEAFVDHVRAAIRKPTPAVVAQRVNDVLTSDCVDALRRCRAPILYLAPTHDHMIPRASLRTILAVRPDVHVHELDGPHLLLQTAPVLAWQAIKDFCEWYRAGDPFRH